MEKTINLKITIMKKYLFMFLVNIVAINIYAQNIEFQSKKFENCFREYLGISNEEYLTIGMIDTIKYLSFEYMDIDTIEDIYLFNKLETAYFSNNNITDITPFANLPNLRYLHLDNNLLEDINVLANASTFELFVSINSNYIDDFSWLKKSNLSFISVIGENTQKNHIKNSDVFFNKLNIREVDSIFNYIEIKYELWTDINSSNQAKLDCGDNIVDTPVTDGFTQTINHQYCEAGEYTISLQVGDKSLTKTIKVDSIINLGDTKEACGKYVLDAGVDNCQYKWSTGVTTKELVVTESGNYTVEVVTPYGCVVSDNVDVVINPFPELVLKFPDFTCEDQTNVKIEANGTLTGKGIESDYNFNPYLAGVGKHIITNTITNEFGCTASISDTILVRALPSLSVNNPDNYCVNSGILQLNATPANGSFVGKGITSVGKLNPILSGVGDVVFTYNYFDGYCANTIEDKITIKSQPTVDFTGLKTEYCLNETASPLVGSPANGSFSNTTGMFKNTFNPSVAGKGTHEIVYRVTQNGCTNEIKKTTVVHPVPEVEFSLPVSVLCSNQLQNIPLTAQPTGGSFAGNAINISNYTIITQQLGVGTHTYSYSYTDLNNCTSQIENDLVIYKVPETHIYGETEICIGKSVTLTVTGGTNYAWNNGQTSASIQVQPTQNTTYKVEVSNHGECIVTDSITVKVMPNPQIPEITIETAKLIVVNAENIQWYFNNNPILGATGTELFTLENGSYKVSSTNALGCTAFSTDIQLVMSDISNIRNINDFNIYPNPNSGAFTVEIKTDYMQTIRLEVVNVLGKRLYSKELNSFKGKHTEEIHLTDAKGVYFVRIISETDTETRRVIILE